MSADIVGDGELVGASVEPWSIPGISSDMVGDGELTGISADPWFMPGISADIVGDSELAGTSDCERIAATPTAPATATKMADSTRRWVTVLLVMVSSFPRWVVRLPLPVQGYVTTVGPGPRDSPG